MCFLEEINRKERHELAVALILFCETSEDSSSKRNASLVLVACTKQVNESVARNISLNDTENPDQRAVSLKSH